MSKSLEILADAAFSPVIEAIAVGRIPGAVLGITDENGGRAMRVAGHAQIEPTQDAMRRDTVFDLASLTKVVFTTTTILRLAEAGRIGLDDPLTVAIPDLRQYDVANAAERKLTFRQCLQHQTHLPGVEPLYSYGQDPQTLRAFVLQREWRAGPPVYSDINFILLGIAIERLTGKPLVEQPLGRRLHVPAGPGAMRRDRALHVAWPRDARAGARRERLRARRRVGTCGAFRHGRRPARFRRPHALTATLLPPAAMAELRRRQTPTRSLGWEMAYPGWSAGDACSANTLGHTGFTGTGLWIDFELGPSLDPAYQPGASDTAQGQRHRGASPLRGRDRFGGVSVRLPAADEEPEPQAPVSLGSREGVPTLRRMCFSTLSTAARSAASTPSVRRAS